jgi:hypothetical protein
MEVQQQLPMATNRKVSTCLSELPEAIASNLKHQLAPEYQNESTATCIWQHHQALVK